MPGTSVQISTRLRAEQRAEIRGRGIRAAAAEDRGAAVGVARDEALRQQHARRLRARSAAAGRRPPFVPAVHRQALRPRALVRQRNGVEPVARIAPAEIAGPARAGRRRRASRKAVRPAPALRPASRASRSAARASVASARSAARRSPSTASGIEVEFGGRTRDGVRSARRCCGRASPSPSAIACSALVTPDSADTTTSTRAPSSAMRSDAIGRWCPIGCGATPRCRRT